MSRAGIGVGRRAAVGRKRLAIVGIRLESLKKSKLNSQTKKITAPKGFSYEMKSQIWPAGTRNSHLTENLSYRTGKTAIHNFKFQLRENRIILNFDFF